MIAQRSGSPLTVGTYRFLKVQEGGPRTTVALRGSKFPEESLLPELEDEVKRIRQRFACRVLTFDLAGLTLMASSILAFLVAQARRGMTIELKNSSPEIQQYLEVTKLNKLIRVV